jgi:hypothetical protein
MNSKQRELIFEEDVLFSPMAGELYWRNVSFLGQSQDGAIRLSFAGVYYVDCELVLNGIKMYVCGEDEKEAVRLSFCQQLQNPNGKLYALLSGKRTNLIFAAEYKLTRYGN